MKNFAKVYDLVILAGGKGSRIKSLTNNSQKCIYKFNGKFFLDYVLNLYSKYNLNKIYILTGYKHQLIHKYFDKKFKNFSRIECIREKRPLGTGGALFNLKKKKVNDFFLVNGDTIFDINLNELVSGLKNKTLGVMSLTHSKYYKSNLKLSSLVLKKGKPNYSTKGKFMNGGVYFFKKKILNYIAHKNLSLEKEIIPNLINNNLLIAKKFANNFFDIGTKKIFKKTKSLLRKNFYKPAVFLDRDGVINQDNKYVYKINDFKLRKGVLKGLQTLVKKNYYIFVVTNQAGIAKNKFSEKEFFKLHKFIKSFFLKKNIFIDDTKYCFHHPKAKIKKYQKNCQYRKPGNKMILNLYKNWDINLKKSFMIGDKLTDEICAKKSQLKFYYAKKNFNIQIKEILNEN